MKWDTLESEETEKKVLEKILFIRSTPCLVRPVSEFVQSFSFIDKKTKCLFFRDEDKAKEKAKEQNIEIISSHIHFWCYSFECNDIRYTKIPTFIILRHFECINPGIWSEDEGVSFNISYLDRKFTIQNIKKMPFQCDKSQLVNLEWFLFKDQPKNYKESKNIILSKFNSF